MRFSLSLFLILYCLTTSLAQSTSRPVDVAFRYKAGRSRPLILAHRGGPGPTDTENSLVTFRQTAREVPDAILEMDVRMTVDSVLVLLHDDDITRTTTGTGLLKTMMWSTLNQVRLRNLKGEPTTQKMALFSEVLRWASDRKVLMAIDAKPGTDLNRVMQAIEQAGALDQVFLICYSVADAKRMRTLFPDLWVALGFETVEQLNTVGKEIELRNLIALASIRNRAFYDAFHRQGILCTASTYGRTGLDDRPLADVADQYRQLVRVGADIVTTDRPVVLSTLFQSER
ncbi:glycerophosphoryl diester phosphodiesterase [Spirosoma oryzae]|uniref:Glycerophosphoryl diester phosphodiesterase n=1 Tax=Spirosoma oryzae TaxID=1469603 RepID=A0A2T0T0F2_9BACT|nr:glycerophosphodiester phosphodiesterase family protein [Spirosoma oryzae]PRY39136.1 glycerophosphoryl diester phosphodiesterase [Spirosoma oryzae]